MKDNLGKYVNFIASAITIVSATIPFNFFYFKQSPSPEAGIFLFINNLDLAIKSFLFLCLQILFGYAFSLMANKFYFSTHILVKSLAIVVLFFSALQSVSFLNIFFLPNGTLGIENDGYYVIYFIAVCGCLVTELFYCHRIFNDYSRFREYLLHKLGEEVGLTVAEIENKLSEVEVQKELEQLELAVERKSSKTEVAKELTRIEIKKDLNQNLSQVRNEEAMINEAIAKKNKLGISVLYTSLIVSFIIAVIIINN